MQTNLVDFFKNTKKGKEADSILRSCVHCGFCNATCPTYQILGNELDGPRGRIYLIKQILEGKSATASTQKHLDSCLTCRNCETTCPSGVNYGRLVDIGREVVETQVKRNQISSFIRWTLKLVLTNKILFKFLYKIGLFFRPFLPNIIKNKIIIPQNSGKVFRNNHKRKMLLLEGCVQPAISPNINASAKRILDYLGVELIEISNSGCCGAIRHHLNDHSGALKDMKKNIDAWWPYIDKVEAVISTASGCGITLKEYGNYFEHDSSYAKKAKIISSVTKDLCEIFPEFQSSLRKKINISKKVVFHPPCTLQHGQKINGKVESLLQDLGVDVRLCKDSHLCCGSAGTYSILQPKIANNLRNQKIKNLEETQSDVILSSNIGCLSHLQPGTSTPVIHWIEFLDSELKNKIH